MATITRKVLHRDLFGITQDWIRQSESPEVRESIESLAAQVSQLLDESSTLQEERSATNAKIGKHRSAGNDVADLIGQVKDLSVAIKVLDAKIGETTSSLLLLQPLSNSSGRDSQASQRPEVGCPTVLPGMPGQFLHDQFIESNLHASSDTDKPSAEISECTEGSAWDNYVTQHPRSTHYHQYAWRALIDRNFGHTSVYLKAHYNDGTLSGILPVVHMKSALFGSFLLSMPWLIYGGALATDEASHIALGNHVKRLMCDRNCSHVDLREVHPREDWRTIKGKVAMVLTLPENHSTFNINLGSKLRAQIKRASRKQPTIQFGGSELVSAFYRVFSEKMRDLGTPVYHRKFFEDIARTFPESAIFVVVMVDGQAAAAACLLTYRDTVEVPWAAARKRHNRAGINMFMYHAMLEEAIRRGYRFFDFGRSTVGESTYRFKRQWGAEPYALEWQRYSEIDPAEDVGDVGMMMRLGSSMWKRMPVFVTNVLGPRIAGNLPW